MTFWKVTRVTREGPPKLTKIQCGVKLNIIERATQMAKILGGVKFNTLGLLFSQKSASNS